MNTADIVNLYRYNEWANHRLTGATTGLAVDALTRNLGGSYKCIRDVLAHIISVEWVWFERWNGVSPTSVPDWVAGDVAVLTTHLSDVEARRARFLEELTDSYL